MRLYDGNITVKFIYLYIYLKKNNLIIYYKYIFINI